jgi:hypothetical protein
MEEQVLTNNPTKVATKWALISAATGVVITYAFELMSIDPNSPLKYIGYIPFVVFLFIAQKEFKDQLGGYISFGTAFSTGFRYALFTGLLTALFVYLYVTILSPEVFEKALEGSRAGMEAKGMSDGDIEKAMGIAHKWGPLMGAFFSAIAYAILGAILALIGAAIFKKERSAYDLVDDAIDPTV